MSGDQLRHYAVIGDANRVRNLLAGGANPCSSDETGLTALHYSVWNGHVDCVALLLANDRGKRPKTGEGCSVMDMQSEAGYTALHICATSSVSDSVTECCRILMMHGANYSLRDANERLALDVAREGGNNDVVRLLENPPTEKEMEYFSCENRGKHKVQKKQNISDDDTAKEEKSGKDRVLIPEELDMHEHQIMASAKSAFNSDRNNGAQNIRDLSFALNQAELNVVRREQLANSRFKGEWKRISFPG